MTTRRAFLAETAGAVAGLAFVGCDLLSARPAAAQTARRQVTVAGRRVKTIDVHAHAAVPEAMALMSIRSRPPGSCPGAGDDHAARSGSPRWTRRASTSRRSASTPTGTRRSATSRRGSARSRTRSSPRLRGQPGALRGLRHRGAPAPRSRGGPARGGREEVRPARRRHRRQRRRRGDLAIRSSTRSGPRPRSSACWSSSTRRARAELNAKPLQGQRLARQRRSATRSRPRSRSRT